MDASYSFCSGSFIGLLNAHIWSFLLINYLLINFQIFFSFLSKYPKGLLLETHSGLVNVDGVFLDNKFVNGPSFSCYFLWESHMLCVEGGRLVLSLLVCFPKEKKFHDCIYGYYFVCFSMFMNWRGLFNDDHFKLFGEFTKPFPLLSINSVSWLTSLPT